MQLNQVKVAGRATRLHNYYRPDRFFSRDNQGTLRTAYGNRAMLVSEDLIVGFQAALQEEVGDAAAEIMYRCGLEWGRNDMKGFSERFPEEFGRTMNDASLGVLLETWWWPLQVSGWGAWSFDLSHRKEGLIFVDLYESAVAKSIGNVGKVVCHFYAGMFASAFSAFAGRELSGIEIQCYSTGEEFCKFLIGSSKRINAAQFWVEEGASAAEIMARL